MDVGKYYAYDTTTMTTTATTTTMTMTMTTGTTTKITTTIITTGKAYGIKILHWGTTITTTTLWGIKTHQNLSNITWRRIIKF